ncbi:MAG TPA: oligosaccharide flippase family protein [Polyangia bacterium]|nr:oligosaccharide flippase family protein [Polyangia bacterium]
MIAQAPTRREDAAHAARSGLSQVLAMFGQGLLPIHRILVSRLFGQTAYGIYRAGADLCDVAINAGLAGADKGLLRYVAGHRAAGEKEEESRALGTGLRLAGGFLFLLAIALAVAAPFFARIWGKSEFRFVLPVLAPTVFAGGGVLVLMAATLAVKVTRINLLVRGIGDPFLLLAATLIAYLVRPTVGGLAVAHLCSYVALLGLAWVGANVVYGPGEIGRALRARTSSGFIRFALPLGASGLMNGFLQRMNIFILSGYSGAASVAVFAASEELGRSIIGVRYAFDSIVTPMMSEAFFRRDRERLRYNLALMTRWVASASAPIAVTLFVLRPRLLSLYGSGYANGVTAMGLLIVGHLINGVMGLTPYVVVMSGRSSLFFWDNLGAAALNLVLSLWLIPRHGVTGAAVASLCSVAGLQGVLALQAYWLERVHAFEWPLLKPFLAAGAAFGVERAVGRLPLPAAAQIAATIVAGAVGYAAVLLALRPGEEERRFLLGLWARLSRRGRAP